jgi:nucleotide-binding universal stress UspA family protein
MRSATTPLDSRTSYEAPVARPAPILVATSGAESAPVLATARFLADRLGRDVRVLSVVDPPAPAMLAFDGVPAPVPDLESHVQLRRARVSAQLREALGPGVDWPVDVVVGERSREIASAAHARGASLVVMGTGRHDIAARLFGGEIAVRTIQRADVPVLTVAGELRAPPRLAVAAIDFSPSSVVAARAALALLDDGATLCLVHVWARGVVDHPTVREADEAYERALPRRFARVEAALGDRGGAVVVRSVALVGRPVDELLGFARAHHAELVAVGRRGPVALERHFVGHVSSSLVRAAPCAVLVTPDPPRAERETLLRLLVGTVESTWPDEWVPLLDEFSRRNAGRPTALEEDAPSLGAQLQETGRVLVGASYDPRDRRVVLTLGDARRTADHHTRLIDAVTSVAVHNDADGRDVALRVTHGDGQTLLTFPPHGR